MPMFHDGNSITNAFANAGSSVTTGYVDGQLVYSGEGLAFPFTHTFNVDIAPATGGSGDNYGYNLGQSAGEVNPAAFTGSASTEQIIRFRVGEFADTVDAPLDNHGWTMSCDSLDDSFPGNGDGSALQQVWIETEPDTYLLLFDINNTGLGVFHTINQSRGIDADHSYAGWSLEGINTGRTAEANPWKVYVGQTKRCFLNFNNSIPSQVKQSTIFDIQTTGSSETFTLPLISITNGYNFLVDWGDGNSDRILIYNDSALTHTYATANTYTINISGYCEYIKFFDVPTDRLKIVDFKQWGKTGWTDCGSMFQDCTNIIFTAGPECDTRKVTAFDKMFQGCVLGNPDVSQFEFDGISNSFNGFMRDCEVATPDTSQWVLPIEKNYNLQDAFNDAFIANPDMTVFPGATSLTRTFSDSSLANPDISFLNISALSNMSDSLINSAFSDINYDKALVAFAAQAPNIVFGITAHFGSAKYTEATAKEVLEITYGWNITDGGISILIDTVIEVQTTTPNEDFEFHLGNGSFNFTIFWGDGQQDTITSNTDPALVHNYVSSGNHDITVSGLCEHFFFGSTPEATKVIDVKQWGKIGLTNCSLMFSGCTNAVFSAGPVSDTSNVISFAGMFQQCTNVPDVSGFDTSSATTLDSMFSSYSGTTPDVSNFNTPLVSDISNMFVAASSSDPDISSWSIVSLTDADDFSNTGGGFSDVNYDKMLVAWAAQAPNIQSNVTFHAGTAQYSEVAARNVLTQDYNWVITDGGVNSIADTVMTIQTTGSSEEFILPFVNGFNYNCNVNWGDGTDNDIVVWNDANLTHTYATADDYVITISGLCETFKFGDQSTHALKVIEVSQWGKTGWTSCNGMFNKCENVIYTSGPDSDTSRVTNFTSMFQNNFIGDPDVSGFDTSSGTNMSSVFRACSVANPDVSNWDVSNCIEFGFMFFTCSLATPDTSNWDLGGNTTTTNITFMFTGATAANPVIAHWKVQGVSSYFDAFDGCVNAELLGIENWPTNSANFLPVFNTTSMFSDCINADPDISGWDISVYNTGRFMFDGSGLTDATYDKILVAWAAQTPNIGNNVEIHFGTAKYTESAARAVLTDTHNWDITDGGAGANFDNMVLSVQTTTIDEAFILPFRSGKSYNCVVNWGDGSEDTIITYNDAALTHTYASSDTYDITISGLCETIYFNNGGDKLKLVDVKQWGRTGLTSMENMFYGCENCVFTAGPQCDTSAVTNMRQTFRNCHVGNPNVSQFDTSLVTNISAVFRSCDIATPDVSNWNTANCTNISSAFQESYAMNPDVTNWNTAKATNMSSVFRNCNSATPNTSNWDASKSTTFYFMFYKCYGANPDVAGWVTTNTTTIGYMFSECSIATPDTSAWVTDNVDNMTSTFFRCWEAVPDTSNWNTGNVLAMNNLFEDCFIANPDVSGWDTSKVTTFQNMFEDARIATPDTSNWNTSSATNMEDMFKDASIANPDVSSFNIGLVTNCNRMFQNTSFDTVNYDKLLSAWAAQSPSIQQGVSFDANGQDYNEAASRNLLANTFNWIITDGESLATHYTHQFNASLGGFTFTRASTQTAIAENGKIYESAIDEPVYPGCANTGSGWTVAAGFKGILFEAAGVNELTAPLDFTDPAWSSGLSSITPGASSPIDGQVATTLVEQGSGAGSQFHYVSQNFTYPAVNVPVSYSFFIKAGTKIWSGFYARNQSSTQLDIACDLLPPVIQSTNVNVDYSEAVLLADDWTRFTGVSFDTGASNPNRNMAWGMLDASDGSDNYVGDGSSSALLAAAQLEFSQYPTSLMLNGTRALASCTQTLASMGIPDTVNNITAEIKYEYIADRELYIGQGDRLLFTIYSSNERDRLSIYFRQEFIFRIEKFIDNSRQRHSYNAYNDLFPVKGEEVVVRVEMSSTGVRGYINNILRIDASFDTGDLLTPLTEVNLGNNHDNSGIADIIVKEFSVWPDAVPPA